MAELIQTPVETDGNRRPGAARRILAAHRDWPTRGALFLWIGASGAVWIALAASAIWIY